MHRSTITQRLFRLGPRFSSWASKGQPLSRSPLPDPLLARGDSADFDSCLVKIIEESEGFGIVGFEAFRSVCRFGAGHAAVAVRAEIPHRQFGKVFVWI